MPVVDAWHKRSVRIGDQYVDANEEFRDVLVSEAVAAWLHASDGQLMEVSKLYDSVGIQLGERMFVPTAAVFACHRMLDEEESTVEAVLASGPTEYERWLAMQELGR